METEQHDDNADPEGPQAEPLGPATPDDQTEAGDTPEAHDGITPHDLPKDHLGRNEAEHLAGGEDGTTTGNV